MPYLWKRLVVFLIILIAILQVSLTTCITLSSKPNLLHVRPQIIHMALLSHLEQVRSDRKRRVRGDAEVYINGQRRLTYKEYTDADLARDRKKMERNLKDASIIDSSGEYQIIHHLMRAQSLGLRNFIRQDVSLISQSSISQLKHLPLLSHRWNGLISVAVFALHTDISAMIEAILLLRLCSPLIRYNTSFHVVFPLRMPSPKLGAKYSDLRSSIESISTQTKCINIESLLDSFDASAMNYDHSGVPYPNNLLRNVARRSSFTEFVFVVDMDLVVNQNLRSDFLSLAKENNLFAESQKSDKNVYVVAAYEVKDDLPDARIPKDKTQLLELISLLEARPFYFELCWKCQKYTDYETWQREPQGSKLAVMFEVLWRDPWEPFYISRNSAPYYDERFRQYGFNRISQVCEMHIAGYKFSVLNNAFVIHKGQKSADSFHVEKDLEQERNRILFRQLKVELKDRYPESSRRCY